jgi:hypothetical protein
LPPAAPENPDIKWLYYQIIDTGISVLCFIIKEIDNQTEELNYQINQHLSKNDTDKDNPPDWTADIDKCINYSPQQTPHTYTPRSLCKEMIY